MNVELLTINWLLIECWTGYLLYVELGAVSWLRIECWTKTIIRLVTECSTMNYILVTYCMLNEELVAGSLMNVELQLVTG